MGQYRGEGDHLPPHPTLPKYRMSIGFDRHNNMDEEGLMSMAQGRDDWRRRGAWMMKKEKNVGAAAAWCKEDAIVLAQRGVKEKRRSTGAGCAGAAEEWDGEGWKGELD